jgi:hypothetical protein
MFSSKKDKAQIKGDFDPACAEADVSGCAPMAGSAKKVNSRGVWQTRHFYLNNKFLVYKENAAAKASQIKGVVDLSVVESVQTNPDANEMSVRMAGGESFPVRYGTADEMWAWVAAVEARIAWVRGSPSSDAAAGGEHEGAGGGGGAGKHGAAKAQQHGGYKSSVYSKDTSGCPPRSGNVKKVNSSNVWQMRYFYINNEFLIYKKDSAAGDKDIKGALDVSDMTAARPLGGDVEIALKAGEPFVLRCADEQEATKW